MNDRIEPTQAGKEFLEPVIYIGPDIPGVKQYSVYNHGLPDALKEKAKEHPVFLSLIIPVGKMPQANKELLRKGSALNVLFEKANQLKKEI